MLINRKPSTERQIAASQANGCKSRGPVTAKGKRNSAGHNLKHGFIAKALLFKGESAQKFDLLRDALFAEFLPQSPVEIHLVGTMLIARWRQIRIWGLERIAIATEIAKSESQAAGENAGRSCAEVAAEACEALARRSRWIERMNSHEFRFERQYHAAMTALRLHRAWRARELKNSAFEPGI